jgi:chemotaxis protein CheX
MLSATASAVDILVGSVTDVFETMVFRQILPKATTWGSEERPQSQIVGSVGFTGSSNGLVAFHATIEGAREVASAMLGGPADDDALPDVVGEITNMIAGAFRTRMARPDDTWAITVPTVTMGTDFKIKPITTGDRATVAFTMDVHDLYVELIITPAVEGTV